MDKKKPGKKNRANGKKFELDVRKMLESVGWKVSKWCNNVKDNKLIPAKSQYNPFFKRIVGEGSGFPDFIAFMYEDLDQVKTICCPRMIGTLKKPKNVYGTNDYTQFNSFKLTHIVIGVECKINGYLTKEEKEKCQWLLDNKIFSKIFIAKKEGKEIIMNEFGVEYK
jgi:hypothetical protein